MDELREDIAAVNGGMPPLHALETIASAMHDLDVDAPPQAFYSRICSRICELTSLDRAVLFRYDERLRDVLAFGAEGVDLDVFRARRLSVASAPPAELALQRDAVVATEHAEDDVDPAFRDLVSGRRVLWVPMVAAERWIGVIAGTQPPGAPPPHEGERSFLFALAKASALAAVARTAARQHAQAARMRARLDLAREIHDGVVQRLFGVALALEPLAGGDPGVARCRDELQAALGELRAALERPLAPDLPGMPVPLARALERMATDEPPVRLVRGSVDDVPGPLEPLVQATIAEAARNAAKHGRPSVIEVALDPQVETLVVEVVNDGADDGAARRTSSTAMGLRLLGLEALQVGGVVEYGPREPGRWVVRLVVPVEA